MKPIEFFIAGVQKSGTTALDTYLRCHPDIQMAKIKEVHFFDDESIDWSAPDYSRLHDAFPDEKELKLRGEATPIYTYWPSSLERIQRYNAGAKIIMGLRHPTFRAYSHWRMETKRNAEELSFREATGWPARNRVVSAPNSVHRVFSYVERGYYSLQVERLLRLFPRSQVMFFRTDVLWADPLPVLERMQTFLGVEHKLQVSRDYIVPVHSWTGEVVPAADRLFLDKLFEADIRRTAKLSGISLEDWLDPRYSEPMRPIMGVPDGSQ